MKNLFPNIETAIIFLFVVCVSLWGVSRCNKKRESVALEAVTNNPDIALDTTSSSPAAVRLPPKPTPVEAPPSVSNNPIPSSYSNQPTAAAPAAPSAAPAPSGTLTAPSLTPKTPSNSTASTPSVQPKTAAPPQSQAGTTLYVLIEGLNLRTQPNLRSKSLGKLKLHDRVIFMEEVTDIPETVRLADGTEITKPWYKIKTKRGTVGWAHGSGLDFYRRKPQGGI